MYVNASKNKLKKLLQTKSKTNAKMTSNSKVMWLKTQTLFTFLQLSEHFSHKIYVEITSFGKI